MKKIKTRDLKAGMRFTETVYLDKDTILVQSEIPLKQREIDRLAKWKIEEVQTNGILIAESGSKVDIGDSGLPVTSGINLPYSSSKGLGVYKAAVERMDAVSYTHLTLPTN